MEIPQSRYLPYVPAEIRTERYCYAIILKLDNGIVPVSHAEALGSIPQFSGYTQILSQQVRVEFTGKYLPLKWEYNETVHQLFVDFQKT
jgi:hypothetical protein